MDFTFSPDVLKLRDMLRRFMENEVRPLESKYFTTGVLEPEQRARLRTLIEQMGLWGANVPFDYDGGELDQVTACLLEEELGKTCIPLEIGDIPPMLYACQGEQVKRYLIPVIEGSRRVFLAARETVSLKPQDWTTEASSDSSGYIINGTKLLVGAPRVADFLVVFARTEQGYTAFFLDVGQRGLEIKTNGQASASFKDCRVESTAMLGEYGQALTLGAAEAPRCWIRMGARYVGFVERLLEMSAEYARDWLVMGRALSERPAVQRMLAEIQVQLESCRWLVYHAAWMADEQQMVRIPAAQVQLATGMLLRKTVDYVTMIYGGPGPFPQTEQQRFLMSLVPNEVMDMLLESATAVVATEILASTQRS